MALTANQDYQTKDGELLSMPVEDNVHIYQGAQTVVNAAGFLEPLTEAAGKKFAGRAYEECDNTLAGHAQGGKRCRVERGGVGLVAAASITQAMVGDVMYGKDDATVDESTTLSVGVKVGVLVEYVSATLGWVDYGQGIGSPVSEA